LLLLLRKKLGKNPSGDSQNGGHKTKNTESDRQRLTYGNHVHKSRTPSRTGVGDGKMLTAIRGKDHGRRRLGEKGDSEGKRIGGSTPDRRKSKLEKVRKA